MAPNLLAMGRQDSAQRMYHKANVLSSSTNVAEINNIQVLRQDVNLLSRLVPWLAQQSDTQLLNTFWLSPMDIGLVYLSLDDKEASEYWFQVMKREGEAEEQRLWLNIVRKGMGGDFQSVLPDLEK